MEPESEFDLMNYSELRFQAKHFGVKANLKTEMLRKELKRVSMLGSVGGVDSIDGITTNKPDENEIFVPLSGPVSLPIKTPAHVTRRKHSRLPPQPLTSHLPLDVPVSDVDKRSVLPKVKPESLVSAGAGIGDETMADPLGEAKALLEDVRPYLSEDEDADEGKSKGANLSAFLSEGEEEFDKDITSNGVSKVTVKIG